MVKVEFGMVKDKPWFFYEEGQEQPETVFVNEIYGKTVRLSNGKTITTDRFYEVMEPAIDESPMEPESQMENLGLEGLEDIIDDGSEAGPKNFEHDPVAAMMAAVQTDSNGVPLLGAPTLQQKQQPGKTITKQAQPVPTVHDSPLIALTEKGQTKLVKMTFQLEVPTVNKTLFNALVETYPVEEIEVLLDHMIGKIGIENIKDAIKEKLHQYYKSKKNVTS